MQANHGLKQLEVEVVIPRDRPSQVFRYDRVVGTRIEYVVADKQTRCSLGKGEIEKSQHRITAIWTVAGVAFRDVIDEVGECAQGVSGRSHEAFKPGIIVPCKPPQNAKDHQGKGGVAKEKMHFGPVEACFGSYPGTAEANCKEPVKDPRWQVPG